MMLCINGYICGNQVKLNTMKVKITTKFIDFEFEGSSIDAISLLSDFKKIYKEQLKASVENADMVNESSNYNSMVNDYYSSTGNADPVDDKSLEPTDADYANVTFDARKVIQLITDNSITLNNSELRVIANIINQQIQERQ